MIETNAGVPAYLQLYRQIREDIVQGIYPYGGRLPSKRTVAAETSVSIITVEHACALLCDEGYVEARERSGYFVIFRTGDGFAAAAPQVSRVRPEGKRENGGEPAFPFSVLAKTMRHVLSEMGESILARSPNAGCLRLREALRQYLARSRGISAEIGQIIIGSGSEYLYGLIVELLGRDKCTPSKHPPTR